MTPTKWLTGLPMPYYFLSLALILCLPGCFRPTLAQGTPPLEVGLQLGQPVPDNLVLEMVNYHSPTARLSDFKGKLLLLDFYATWCSSSRAPMPLLDSLQTVYGDKLQVLLVSYTKARDTKATVTAFFEKWRNPDGSRYRLPSVVDDTTLVRLFPHKPIPHFVWVGPDGTVQAITRAEQVTAQNINRAITQGVMPPSLLPDMDLSQPLFATGSSLPATSMLHYSILLKGKIDDGAGRWQVRRSGDVVHGVVFANMPLITLYKTVKRNLYPEFGSKGLVLAGIDSARLFQEKSGMTAADWKAKHTYSYDLHLPEGTTGNLYQVILDDLNRYSGYQAALELRETDCLLLVRKGRKDKLKSKGGEPVSALYRPESPSMQNMPITTLIARLNAENTLPMLVVNQTDYTGPADIEIKSGFTNLPLLRKELQAYGLDLVQARRKVPHMVLRELQAKPTSKQLFQTNK